MEQLLLPFDADEHARTRAVVGQEHVLGLLLDEAVLLRDERVAGEDEVAEDRADVEGRAAGEDACAERAG